MVILNSLNTSYCFSLELLFFLPILFFSFYPLLCHPYSPDRLIFIISISSGMSRPACPEVFPDLRLQVRCPGMELPRQPDPFQLYCPCPICQPRKDRDLGWSYFGLMWMLNHQDIIRNPFPSIPQVCFLSLGFIPGQILPTWNNMATSSFRLTFYQLGNLDGKRISLSH